MPVYMLLKAIQLKKENKQVIELLRPVNYRLLEL